MDREEATKIITYDEIIAEAKAQAAKLKPALPSLPSTEELEPIEGEMYAQDKQLIDTVRRHLDQWGTGHGHGFEHLEWVAENAAYVANLECEERDITGELRNEIIQRTWRLGLLHDLQRWRGYQNIHAIEGMIATRQKLSELDIDDDFLIDQVLNHDNINVAVRNDPGFDVPLYSVFAVDHLNWGLEWEEVKWKGEAKKGIPPEQAIHDYHFMEKILQSPNFQQTRWGIKVALPYIQFGLNIAKHIETTFSSKQV